MPEVTKKHPISRCSFFTFLTVDNYSLDTMLLKVLLCQSENGFIKENTNGNIIVKIGFYCVLLLKGPSNESSRERKGIL